MEYQRRFLEQKLHEMSRSFGALLVTGPRQAGKTWMLRHAGKRIFGDRLPTVSFDAPSEIDSFRRDPDLFFANHPRPLFLDEVQHVPGIFAYLKREVDKTPERCQFLLSGSQSFELMRGVTESMAGRVGILDLWPFCVQEARGAPDQIEATATVDLLLGRTEWDDCTGIDWLANDSDDVVPCMLKGGFPRVLVQNAGNEWLEGYRRTYIQRDVREMRNISELGRFDRLVALVAGQTGTILNKAETAGRLGVDNKTVDDWLSVLGASYQVLVLPPYFTNSSKRLVKRPKLYFADIGLALHCQGIRDREGLLNAPHFGQLYETFVIMEIRKLFGHAGIPWDGHFWATPRRREVDLVLPAGGHLRAIEIKHGTRVRSDDLKGLHAFRDSYPDRWGGGMIVSLNPRVERVAEDIWNVPLGLILNGPHPPGA